MTKKRLQAALLACSKSRDFERPATWNELVKKASDPNWNDRFGWGYYVPTSIQEHWEVWSVEVKVALYFDCIHYFRCWNLNGGKRLRDFQWYA